MQKSLLAKCINFGRQLIKTGDLDPLYIALRNTDMTPSQKANWCMAYWLFYDVQVATDATTYAKFHRHNIFEYLLCNYPTLTRGTERRHFRGEKGSNALEAMDRKYGRADKAIEDWFQHLEYGTLAKTVQRNEQFGPWIAFKVADMGEAVLGYDVDFSDCKLGIYREPYRAAQLLLTGDKTTKEDIQPVLDTLHLVFKNMACPHNPDRCISIQEIETILCKFKSHLGGHYPVGFDTRHYKHRLSNYKVGSLGYRLGQNLPIIV
jgi:hypothetical protein